MLDSSDLIVLTATPASPASCRLRKRCASSAILGYREEQIVVLSNHAQGTLDWRQADRQHFWSADRLRFHMPTGSTTPPSIGRALCDTTSQSVLTREFRQLADLARKRVVPTIAPAAGVEGKQLAPTHLRPHSEAMA